MSARVFNPMVLSEMRRMLSTYENNPRPNRSTSSPPNTTDVARVRRDLFGPVDHDDNRRFVERELASQQDRDGDRWGFDFVRESPRKSGPGTARFAWQRVTAGEAVPEPYALRRLPCLQNAAVKEEAAAAAAVGVETAHEDAVSGGEATESSATAAQQPAVNKPAVIQSRIPDYMRVQRRRTFASSPAKTRSGSTSASGGPRPKQARSAPS